MDFLLEINTEEMPLEHVKTALSQLQEKIKKELEAFSVPVNELNTYGTCRRLVVEGNFAASQIEREEQVIGPPKAAALSSDGEFSQAAKGFAKSKGVSVSLLEVVNTERGEYIGFKRRVKGRLTSDILTEILPRIVSDLSFPKMMRWGENSMRFSRPIKNILCMFGEKMVPFSLNGLNSTDCTSGHRIFSSEVLHPKNFSEYKKDLMKNKVVVDPEKRRNMILNQVQKKLAPLEAQLLPDEPLLEKLVYDVEHPNVLLGSFPEEYLKLPLEVLSTAMREGQNLFSVVKGKKQLPYFVGVADSIGDSKGLICRGNERVLKARLEDARFFWNQDMKIGINRRAQQLDHLIFQENLGTYGDKAERLRKIVSYLTDKLDAKKEKKQVMAAADLCKADLLTEMVREFPALQGRVGGLYAKEEGYPLTVWKAVHEHYQPSSMEESSPSTAAGAMLSIADKLDTIVGVLGIGVEVTGSRDPFGLRRNAQGVCKIILEKKLSFSFPRLLDKILSTYSCSFTRPKDELKRIYLDFFVNRLEYIFESQGFRYDIVQAALGPGLDNIYYSFLRLKALDSLKNSPHFEPMILIAKRVNNILRGQPPYKINPDLFAEKEEREMHTSYTIIHDNAVPLIGKGDFAGAQKIVLRMRSSINGFFDHVLVMCEDSKIRRNRLALLQAVSRLMMQIADYSRVVVEGDRQAET